MSTPLRQLLSDILFDDSARADFSADAEGFLHEHGWDTLEGAELQEAVAALGDTMPIETGQAIDAALDNIDFSAESLPAIGAELMEATAALDLADPTAASSVDGETDIEFGSGAETHAAASDDGTADDALDTHTSDEFADGATVDPGVGEPEFYDDAEGIDIDQPLVHDIDNLDDAGVNFDIDDNDIDDLDI